MHHWTVYGNKPFSTFSTPPPLFTRPGRSVLTEPIKSIRFALDCVFLLDLSSFCPQSHAQDNPKSNIRHTHATLTITSKKWCRLYQLCSRMLGSCMWLRTNKSDRNEEKHSICHQFFSSISLRNCLLVYNQLVCAQVVWSRFQNGLASQIRLRALVIWFLHNFHAWIRRKKSFSTIALLLLPWSSCKITTTILNQLADNAKV